MTGFKMHDWSLQKLCRICGCTLTGNMKHRIKRNTSRLNSAFKCKFEEDTADIHPELFCNKCYSTVIHLA